MVGRVHQKVHHLKYGVPPEEMGGTKLDNNGTSVPVLEWALSCGEVVLRCFFFVRSWFTAVPGVF